MVRTRVLVVLGLLTVGLACSRDHGAPHVRPLPERSKSPALRGGGPARSPRNASYKIDARLDTTLHQITATETLTWTNLGASPVRALPFHLYLNAFKNETTLFMRSSRDELRDAAATDAGGWTHVESVKIGGVERIGTLHAVGPDETVVELPLTEPLAAGGTIEVTFKFTAQLPEVFARTGYKGEFHLVGQWFPKIGVRVGPPGAETWECQPLHSNTEFFADFGTYDVALTVPNTHVVAATGVLVNATESPGGTRTLTYHAEDVHDFAWMADPYMEVMSGQAKLEHGTVDVRVYYRPEHKDFAKRHLDAAIGATEQFSAMFGPYPWSVLSVIDPPIDAAIGAGGMEYPTFVTTAGDTVFARPGLRLPEYVTVHEVGHNWFQGMLASNEAVEAWLDEGVNEWADAKVMTTLYGARGSAIDWMGWQAEIVQLRAALADDPSSLPSPIATAAYAFADMDAYGEATYESTLRALSTLEQTVGANKFAAAMKVYATTWAFKHPTGRDLFATLAAELHEDLTWFFAPVFEHVGGMRLAIRSASCKLAHPARGVFGEGAGKKTVTEIEAPETGSYLCEVVITNTGTIHVPVDLELKFEDGSLLEQTWDDHGGASWKSFVFERSSPLTEVWIDPTNKIALDAPVTHHYRLEGDGSASLRGAAWIASVTQTLMQIVGP